MTTTTRDILVMGLPEAGKTTFIAALWHTVSSKEVDAILQMEYLQPSRDHLNEIAKRWRECVAVQRTIQGKERSVTMNLRTSDGARRFQVTLPDTSGEAFQRIFENRKWAASFEGLVNRSDALMFFVHPNSLVSPVRIDNVVEELVSIADGINVAGVEPPSGMPEQAVHWEASRAAAQSKILDLLQLVVQAKGSRPLKIVIVVSAWDLAENENLQPDNWIEKHAPLVWQFLNAHNKTRPFCVFGVSAQGRDYGNHAEMLRDYIKPSERISVMQGDRRSSDITAPVLWAVE
ncbi:MAG: hypothetical protein CXZ00_16700 [Acidobacteria bacterium]|nr:MAG: hypothetical protein CXZ00_16700 [Acidobacteriota bacterium]